MEPLFMRCLKLSELRLTIAFGSLFQLFIINPCWVRPLFFGAHDLHEQKNNFIFSPTAKIRCTFIQCFASKPGYIAQSQQEFTRFTIYRSITLDHD